MRYFVPIVFLSLAAGLHLSNRPGALWVLPYTQTLARRIMDPGAIGPTTLSEQLVAADLTVGFLAVLGGGLLVLSLVQTLRDRKGRSPRR